MKSSLFEDEAALATAVGTGRLRAYDYGDGEGAYVGGEAEALPTLTEAEAAGREIAARRDERAALEQHFAQELERRVRVERERVAAAMEEFGKRQREYFQGVEREVVGLALAVARKILNREARMDPLLLAGAVQVALEQLANAGEATLRVPPSQLSAWREQWGGGGIGRIEGDAGLEPDGCRIETPSGAADLGLAPQLKEIERGFADLLERRDAACVALP